MPRKLLFFIFLITSYVSNAQILSVDRNRGDTLSSKRLYTVAQFMASLDKQNKNLLDVSSSADFSYILPKSIVTVLKASTDFTSNGGEDIQNVGYVHLRARDNDVRRIFPEVFTQYQWNGILGMKRRIVAGSNMRWKAFTNQKLNFYVGLGMMYEYEQWTPESVPQNDLVQGFEEVNSKKIRINQYTKVAWRISDKTDIVASCFVQNALNNLLKPRIASQQALNHQINQWLGIGLNGDFVYDFAPPVPINKLHFSIKGQVSVSF